MNISRPIFTTLISIIISSQAHSGVIASCGSSSGYSYYVDNGFIQPESAGFTDDTITDGVIQLISEPDNEMDIILIDATGQRLSIVKDGAKLVPLFYGGNIHVIAVYPAGVVENYTFRVPTNEVTWTKSSYGQLIDKASVFRAKCLFE
jgi:hypothetical protein